MKKVIIFLAICVGALFVMADDAISVSVSTARKGDMRNSDTVVTGVSVTIPNDSYLSEGNVAQKSELHTHTNKTVLDGITAEKVAGWDNASSGNHSHSNKGVLDNVTQAVIDNSHTHANKTVIDGIASTDVTNWNDANSKKHTHSNKATLDNLSTVDGTLAVSGKKVQMAEEAEANFMPKLEEDDIPAELGEGATLREVLTEYQKLRTWLVNHKKASAAK